MDAPIVAISIFSQNQLTAAQNMIVCARKQKTYVQVDSAQRFQYDNLVTRQTDRLAKKKLRNAQLSHYW